MVVIDLQHSCQELWPSWTANFPCSLLVTRLTREAPKTNNCMQAKPNRKLRTDLAKAPSVDVPPSFRINVWAHASTAF